MVTSRRTRVTEACRTCKRRKERCDGTKPCGRCTERGVASECEFSTRSVIQPGRSSSQGDRELHCPVDIEDFDDNSNVDLDDSTATGGNLAPVLSHSSPTEVPQISRIIQDAKGKHMFIGDSANLSLLQNIRSLVSSSIGSCGFVDDHLRYQMVECAPEGQPGWLHAQLPPQLTELEASYLIKRYIFATNCILDLFDESDLLKQLIQWLPNQHQDKGVLSSMYYLVFAIGAQTSPDDKDELAQVFFDYGRYLTASNLMDDPSISTVQAYSLITMYMLGASRRNAAFMHFGMAVRAAYALGLHRADIATLFSPSEFETRERLWKVIRVLDLFMSSSLGRPPSTSETRDTESEADYSASTDLCAIFEKILTDIYAKRMVSTEVLERISKHQRRWSARFYQGLATDRIKPQDVVDDGCLAPNIGLLHVKEAYYWTIILLTRPFLVENISDHISQLSANMPKDNRKRSTSASNKFLAHACVDSAIRTIDLLEVLLDFEDTPKRLPFVVNSIFVAALVLGASYFGDLYKIFPLESKLTIAQELLARFSHDALAQRNLEIIGLLRKACSVYLDQRAKQHMARHADLVGGIFGQIHQKGNVATCMKRLHVTDSQPETMLRDGSDCSPPFQDVLQQQTALHRDVPQEYDMIANVSINQYDIPSAQFDAFNSGGHHQLFEYPSMDDNGLSYQTHVRDSGYSALDGSNSLPIMSPQTLWFGSYEDGGPLFTTVNASTVNHS